MGHTLDPCFGILAFQVECLQATIAVQKRGPLVKGEGMLYKFTISLRKDGQRLWSAVIYHRFSCKLFYIFSL